MRERGERKYVTLPFLFQGNQSHGCPGASQTEAESRGGCCSTHSLQGRCSRCIRIISVSFFASPSLTDSSCPKPCLPTCPLGPEPESNQGKVRQSFWQSFQCPMVITSVPCRVATLRRGEAQAVCPQALSSSVLLPIRIKSIACWHLMERPVSPASWVFHCDAATLHLG